MKKHTKHYRIITAFLWLTCLSSCASMQDDFAQVSNEQNLDELLILRAKPTNMRELEYECRCMNDKIDDINAFTQNMSKSKFNYIYQSLGREKVGTINSYKTSLDCQQLEN